MKNLICAVLVLIFSVAALLASETFAPDTQTIVVSTVTTAPTQIMTGVTQGAFYQKTTIFNNTGFNLFISTSNVKISTGTVASPAVGATWNAYIPPSSTPFDLSAFFPQDMNGGVYQGPLWAVLGSTSTNGATAATAQPVSIIRLK